MGVNLGLNKQEWRRPGHLIFYRYRGDACHYGGSRVAAIARW